MTLKQRAAQYSLVRRIGYLVRRTRAKAAPAGSPPRILVTSIWKSGTHLVMAAIDQLPDVRQAWVHLDQVELASLDDALQRQQSSLAAVKYGQYATAHLPHSHALEGVLTELGYRTIFVYRDPRDVVLSTVEYVKRLRRHPLHRRFTTELTSDRERIRAAIEGLPASSSGPAMLPIGELLAEYEGWLSASGVLVCRFEDLVGAAGGGSSTQQREMLQELAAHVGRPLDPTAASDLAGRIWSPRSMTFRAGRIGQWRDAFDDELLAVFNGQVAPRLLRSYGYEPAI